MNKFSFAASGVFGRAAIAGLAIAGSLAFAAPASAGITLQTASFYDPSTSADTGRGFTVMSPFLITGTAGPIPFDGLAFCIQLYVDMPDVDPYGNNLATPNLHYEEGLIGSANDGRIGQLVNYGTSLWNLGGGGLADPNYGSPLSIELAAIQGAIWELISGEDIHFAASQYTPEELALYDPKIQDYVDTFDLSGYSSHFHAMYSGVDARGNPLAQGLAYAGTMPVPEPAAWALMLTGFFGAGSVLRRRRALANV